MRRLTECVSMCLDEEGRSGQLRPVTSGAQPMGSIDHYIDRSHNERSEREQLVNNHGVRICSTNDNSSCILCRLIPFQSCYLCYERGAI